MQRLWFKVLAQGQRLDLPVLVDDLPRQVHIAGHIATRYNRGRTLAEVYVLVASAEEAQQVFTNAYARLFAEL